MCVGVCVCVCVCVLTQHVQGALVVGDDHVGPLCLQVLPAAHLKAQTQEVLHMTDQVANYPTHTHTHTNTKGHPDKYC